MDELEIYELILKGDTTQEELAQYLEQLASYDFEKFIYLLYRLDIEEARTRKLISDGGDIYLTLSQWIAEKLEARKKNRDRFTYPDLEDDEGRM